MRDRPKEQIDEMVAALALAGETEEELRRTRDRLADARLELNKLELLQRLEGTTQMTEEDKHQMSVQLPEDINQLTIEVQRQERRLEKVKSLAADLMGIDRASIE